MTTTTTTTTATDATTTPIVAKATRTVKPRAAKVETTQAATTTATTTAKATKATAKTTAKAESKPLVFGLVAGTIAKIESALLKGAVANHVKKGNLDRIDGQTFRLTAQGALLWSKERIEVNPQNFQTIAAYVMDGKTTPDAWAGHPSTQVSTTAKAFPNVVYWGSFASREMRQAFAALWSSVA